MYWIFGFVESFCGMFAVPLPKDTISNSKSFTFPAERLIGETSRRLQWEDIHPGGLQHILMNSPEEICQPLRCIPQQVFASNDEDLMQKFIMMVRGHKTLIHNLRYIRENFPYLIWFTHSDSDGLELCYELDELRNVVQDKINFPSFESNMRHAGLIVVQKAIGKESIKRWGFRDEKKNTCMSKKRERVETLEESIVEPVLKINTFDTQLVSCGVN